MKKITFDIMKTHWATFRLFRTTLLILMLQCGTLNSVYATTATPINAATPTTTSDEAVSPNQQTPEHLVNLEKFNSELDTYQKNLQEKIKNEKAYLNDLHSKLNSSPLPRDPSELNQQFETVDQIWSAAADHLLNLFSKDPIASLPSIPSLEEPPTLSDENDKIAYEEYKAAYQKSLDKYNTLTALKNKFLVDIKAQNFRLLNDSGSRRALLINQCQEQYSCEVLQGINEQYVSGFIREIQILPLKFMAGGINKLVEFQSKLNSGFDNLVDLIRQVLVLIFLIFLPFLAYNFLSWISSKLNVLRKTILSKSTLEPQKRMEIAMWISRLNPFLPSVGMILSLNLARSLLETTDLRELSNLLFYLQVYFVYRATRILLRIFIEFLFSQESLDQAKQQSLRAEQTAKILARLIFIQYAALHLIEDTVRKALVYQTVTSIVLWISIAIMIYEIRNWRSEIYQSFRIRFPNIWNKLNSNFNSRLSSLYLPFLLITIIVNDLVNFAIARLVKFDFFKRILSEIFRRRLERSQTDADTGGAVDKGYLSVFDYYLPANQEFYVDRDSALISEIIGLTEDWKLNKVHDNLVLLIGKRGIGKTTCLKTLHEKINSNDKKNQWIPAKVKGTASFYVWLSELLGSPIQSVEDVQTFDSRLNKKTFLMVDDIHNLFVGQVGGFEAYRLLLEVLNLKTKNLFWCLTVNSHAWSYLQGVFGHEHFCGRTYRLRMWTDAEIQRLILARHDITGFSRSFDNSIIAYGSHNALGEQVETQFFRLLWGQSRGNPRSALMHWVSAISQPGQKQIHVGIPKFIETNLVGTLSDSSLLMLAAITRHDSLSEDEIIETTGINRFTLRKCLKESFDKDLLWSDTDGRIRISSRAQSAIDYFLIGKNFLYE